MYFFVPAEDNTFKNTFIFIKNKKELATEDSIRILINMIDRHNLWYPCDKIAELKLKEEIEKEEE